MTNEQQAKLGELAMWIGTAQQLLAQARSASATNDMRGVLPRGTRTAIADALQSTTEAADGLTPLVKAQEVTA